MGGTEAGVPGLKGLGAVCLEAIVLVTSMVGLLRGGSLLPPPTAPPIGGRGDLMASGPCAPLPMLGSGRVGEKGGDATAPPSSSEDV